MDKKKVPFTEGEIKDIEKNRQDAINDVLKKGIEALAKSKKNLRDAKKAKKDAKKAIKNNFNNFFKYWKEVINKKSEIRELNPQIRNLKQSVDEGSDEIISIGKNLKGGKYSREEAKTSKTEGKTILENVVNDYDEKSELEENLRQKKHALAVSRVDRHNSVAHWWNAIMTREDAMDEKTYQKRIATTIVCKMGINLLKYWLGEKSIITVPEYPSAKLKYLGKRKIKGVIRQPEYKAKNN